MKKLLFCAAVLLLLSSCITQRRCSKRFPCPQADSVSLNVREVIRYRDTLVYIEIPGKVQIQNVPVLVERGIVNSEASVLENDFAISKAAVKDGQLVHELTLKQQRLEKTIPDAIKETIRTEVKTSVKMVAKNYVTGWQWAQIWAGRILALILALFVGYRLVKMRLKMP